MSLICSSFASHNLLTGVLYSRHRTLYENMPHYRRNPIIMPHNPRNPITRSDESLSSSTDQPDSTSPSTTPPSSAPASPPPTYIPETSESRTPDMPSPTYTPIPQQGASTVAVAHNISLIPHHVAHYAPLYPGDRVQIAQEAAIEQELRKSHYKTITSQVSEVNELKMERDALRERVGLRGWRGRLKSWHGRCGRGV
jgi:hypothetical protein